MIREFKSLVGAKVVEFDSGDLLAIMTGIIIDPDSGMVEAFWVKPTTLPYKTAILKTRDILEFKKNLYIRSDKVLAQAEDVIRINEILDDGRTFLGNLVQNEVGHTYGRCDNLSFDTDTNALKQIHCRKSILGVINLDQRIFPYESIIKVLPDMILVKDDATKKDTVIVTTPETATG